tara:strand:+ start:89 stop:274 length:186 start_codon:yes stop_codon:yes gene_type:complete
MEEKVQQPHQVTLEEGEAELRLLEKMLYHTLHQALLHLVDQEQQHILQEVQSFTPEAVVLE